MLRVITQFYFERTLPNNFTYTFYILESHIMDDGSDLRRGKVRRELLPQENVLEEFLRGETLRHPTWITEKKRFFGGIKKVSPCTWRGITCDPENNIISIIGSYGSPILEGNLSWRDLPPTLVRLQLHQYPKLRGVIDLTNFPPCLNR